MQEFNTSNHDNDQRLPLVYFPSYVNSIFEASKTVNLETLNQLFQCIEKAADLGSTFFTGGNGSSMAISEILCCHWTKVTDKAGYPPLKIVSLASNSTLLTALGNDFGYETVFKEQLKYFAKKGDILILFSSSGNSKNIVLAAEEAKKIGMKIVGFTGGTGGKLKSLADLSLHVDFQNTSVTENVHLMLVTSLAQMLARKREQKNINVAP